jgi:cell division protein FtsX
MFLLKLSMRSWKIAPWSQFLSSLVVGFLLLLLGFLFFLQKSLTSVVSRLERQQVLFVYIKNTVPDQKTFLVEKLKSLVGPHVTVQWMGTSEVLASLKETELREQLQALDTEIQLIPRFIALGGVFSRAILDQIKALPEVDSVESLKDRSSAAGAFVMLRWILRVLLVGIFCVLSLGFFQIAQMNASFYRDCLDILAFWGGAQKILFVPGVFSSFLVGLLGGLFALVVWWVGSCFVLQHGAFFMLKGIFVLEPRLVGISSVFLCCLGGLMGMIAGVLSSWTQIRNMDYFKVVL